MSTDRTALALAACEGMTNEDLAQRGPQGFIKMILRKRKYATAARTLAAGGAKVIADNKALTQQVAQLQAQLAQAKAQIAALQELDAPITDTSEAAALIASLSAGTGKKD